MPGYKNNGVGDYDHVKGNCRVCAEDCDGKERFVRSYPNTATFLIEMLLPAILMILILVIQQ